MIFYAKKLSNLIKIVILQVPSCGVFMFPVLVCLCPHLQCVYVPSYSVFLCPHLHGVISSL